MSCSNFIHSFPPQVLDEIELTDPELEKIRDKVLEKREEDITLQLYFFEDRALTEEINEFNHVVTGEIKPINWETTRTVDIPTSEGIYTYELTDARNAKKCFLMGCLEVQLCESESEYETDDSFSYSDNENQFIIDEISSFSYEMMKIYWEKYQSKKPSNRHEKILLAQNKSTIKKKWLVYVPLEVKEWYYGDRGNIHINKTAFPSPLEQTEMDTINFRLDTEKMHAAVANYITWQKYLCAKKKHEGDEKIDSNTGKIGSSMSTTMKKAQENALKDDSPISDEMKTILKKILQTSYSSLTEGEKSIIEKASKKSPKIRSMLKVARHQYKKTQIAAAIHRYATGEATQTANKSTIVGQLKELGSQMLENIKYFEWRSPLCKPQLAGVHVGAADIPEETESYTIMKDGTLNIFYSWKSESNNNPAYLQVKWEKTMRQNDEIWIEFFHRETKEKLSEIFLGTYSEGTKTIPQNLLNFDLFTEKWDFQIILKGQKT